ncbi:MAG: radical SAM protein [Candidatus Aminicenantes bacterium]|nr:radical SAM protein [Candidatus Aminicenantes bacterium]
MDSQLKIFAPAKVTGEQQKIAAYLRGERIFPTTIEMDLTQLCTRSCPGCPYKGPRRQRLTMPFAFLDRLLSILGRNTPGIVFSGGEATIVPHFPEAVALARKKGFKEIAVISNGGFTHHPKVQDALLEHVTSIRISLYDWQDGESPYFIDTLKKISRLRERIEKEGSHLEIGASLLTRSDLNHRYETVGRQALAAGIDWLYFHPYCVDWHCQRPLQADQTGVLAAIEKLKTGAPRGANIQVPFERYSQEPLYFEKLHGAHFLIQVGADGVNYAGPECKYDKNSELLDLNEYMQDDFLWHPRRLKRLDELNSDTYAFIGTRHRPPMFSDYIQKLIRRQKQTAGQAPATEPADHFSYPCIL